MHAIDLHTHSAVSDGTETPTALVEQARAAGLEVIALTDHDTDRGIGEAREAATRAGLGFLPGMEVSAKHRGRSIHLLALGNTPAPGSHFALALEEVRDSREKRAQRIVERLSEDFPISWEAVLEIASGRGVSVASVGRPHIADALTRAGVVTDRSEAFQCMLAPHSPYYVPYRALDAADAIAGIHDCGALAVGAHLMTGKRGKGLSSDACLELVESGLDGLEVFHREHSEPAREALLTIAREKDLIVTGGSDYHGSGKPNRLGENTTSEENLERLLESTSARL
ncbi:PHP domain-containing protein [Dermabacter sp. HSID17554]|uniref:PHP domain-containing protein n=1 Tax=Dermabacter sp. HSID17554 TaxID=2419511 RepID=UPI000F887998|nr:PHP domain-containing protein [Dermabacter sp. HSID17554]RUP86085.1 PHP domain-containing protein [Dermabacter sp. HSID17554]